MRKTRDPRKIKRDWRGRFARVPGHRESSNTKDLRAGVTERRLAVAEAAREERESRTAARTKPKATTSRPQTPTASAQSSPQPSKPAQTPRPSSDYGMHYNPKGEGIVARARKVDDKDWDKLPVENLPARTPLEANEEMLVKPKSIDRVVSGEVPFREGYTTKLWRDSDGKLHIVDGHHRVAMHYALNKPMPVRIMDEKKLKQVTSGPKNPGDRRKAMLDSGEWKMDENGVINDVAAISTDADFKSEDNQKLSPEKRLEVRHVAEEAFINAVNAAPAMRATVRDVVATMHGTMKREYDDKTGAPTAAKTEHSIYRKIQKEMLEKKIDDPRLIKLKDTVRFSATFDESNYAEAVDKMRKTLEKAGYKQIKPPANVKGGAGGWELGGYRGINMAFQDKNGLEFELQMHTEASLIAAEANHAFYDITRKSDDLASVQDLMDSGKAEAKTGISPAGMTPVEYINACNSVMLSNAEKVKVPEGVSMLRKITDDRGNKTFVVVNTANVTTYVDPETGETIEKPRRRGE